jgi:hypothetical protein
MKIEIDIDGILNDIGNNIAKVDPLKKCLENFNKERINVKLFCNKIK